MFAKCRQVIALANTFALVECAQRLHFLFGVVIAPQVVGFAHHQKVVDGAVHLVAIAEGDHHAARDVAVVLLPDVPVQKHPFAQRQPDVLIIDATMRIPSNGDGAIMPRVVWLVTRAEAGAATIMAATLAFIPCAHAFFKPAKGSPFFIQVIKF